MAQAFSYLCERFRRHQFGTLRSPSCAPEPEGVLGVLRGSSASFHLLHPLRSEWRAHRDMAGKLRLGEVKPPVRLTPRVTRSPAGMLTWVICFEGSLLVMRQAAGSEPSSGAAGEGSPSLPFRHPQTDGGGRLRARHPAIDRGRVMPWDPGRSDEAQCS